MQLPSVEKNPQAIQIGFGGGCHWCTEAIFQQVHGVHQVEQGWIAPRFDLLQYSEAVIVHFDPMTCTLKQLIEIHLHTHSSSSNHAKRAQYRSAIYSFGSVQHRLAKHILDQFIQDFKKPIVTEIIPFGRFKRNEERYLNYYKKHKGNQFCNRYIEPKLVRLSQELLVKDQSNQA